MIEPEEFILVDTQNNDPNEVLRVHNKNMSIAADMRSQLLSLISVIKSRNKSE